MNATQCFLIFWRNMRHFVNVVLPIGHIPHIPPWYNDDIKEAKKCRKRLERRWWRTRLLSDRKWLQAQRLCVSKLIEEAKSSFYKNKINACDDYKTLFQVAEELLKNTTAWWCWKVNWKILHFFSHLRYPKIVNWILIQSLKMFILRGHKVRRRSNFCYQDDVL